jgi:hypothetical protein
MPLACVFLSLYDPMWPGSGTVAEGAGEAARHGSSIRRSGKHAKIRAGRTGGQPAAAHKNPDAARVSYLGACGGIYQQS